jgi:hypothetical protein
MGNVSGQVAARARCPVIMVKRRSTMFASMLRETILPTVQRIPEAPAAQADA